LVRAQGNSGSDKPHGSFNLLTQRVWVAALGRYGPPSLPNPWNRYEGDYSDQDLIDFGLEMRQGWLDKDNLYLLPHAIGSLARDCKDQRLRDLWRHIGDILPGGGRLIDMEQPDAEE
jgi:hypothetical protein